MTSERGRSRGLVAGLISAQAANAAFDIVALYPVARSSKWAAGSKQWAEEHLDHLGFPRRLRFLFPIVKVASVVGLLGGLRWRPLGRLTAGCIVAYFLAGLGFHVRSKDPAQQYAPAVGMLVWSCLAFRAFGSEHPAADIA